MSIHYYSENDIRDIILSVLEERELAVKGGKPAANITSDFKASPAPGSVPQPQSTLPKGQVPVEISARHVHLTQEAVECLFGPGHKLTCKRELSQPGEFLAEERVKIITAKGDFSNVAVLGPERAAVQVEISLTDSKALGVKAPVNLSGDLTGAESVVLLGPKGIYRAEGSTIVAKSHIHMTPKDAADFGVHDGQVVRVKLQSNRPATLDDVVIRVKESFKLAMHVDIDEGNAAGVTADTVGIIC